LTWQRIWDRNQTRSRLPQHTRGTYITSVDRKYTCLDRKSTSSDHQSTRPDRNWGKGSSPE
jgi:hypothetical protein